MRLGTKLGVTILLLAFASLSASSAEVVILQNGFTMRLARHEVREGVTRLYFADLSGSFVDVPTDQVVRFEEEELPPEIYSPREAIEARALIPTVPKTLQEMVSLASSNNRIDPDLIMTVIGAESGFNANAVSRKGAQGLMQLMPQTASRLGVEDPLDPSANVQGGTRYLRELLDLYHNDVVKALAAYNAGPKRVEQYGGVPPYVETQTYIAKVIRDFNRKKLARVSAHHDSGNKSAVVKNSKTEAPSLAPQPSSE
ncbi:MAG TPA: lytic transglycosylase domain-containing protein [Candidatus Sulfotelmatobacter sp.]|nr:lytic transglycosylase domain-containing protein [Candidatus Sulfotelmatobacter sp.]